MKTFTIHPEDNVAVVLDSADGKIPNGHKVAISDIQKGDHVIKYGSPIGHATTDIKTGDHVHTSNIKTNLEGELSYDYKGDVVDPFDGIVVKEGSFQGFERSNGEVGIRK